MTELVPALRAICGGNGVLTGADATGRSAGIWHPDNINAEIIVRPRNTAEVSAVMALCQSLGQSVVPHGGLTGLVHGADTLSGDLVLSTELMSDIESVDPANRTMTVQAGVVLQRIHEAADEADLHFALDLGARGSCNIGGNVATNAGGNAVIRYGMAKEQVLGLEAVLADGTVVSSMNHMVKNNAGYDLKHLFMGSEGTLGIITRLVLRMREKPVSQCTALLACDSLDGVARLLKHMDSGLGGQLSAYEVMWDDYYTLITAHPANDYAPLEAKYPYYVLVEALGSHQAEDQARFERVLSEASAAGLLVDAVVANSGREREALWRIRDDVERTMEFGPPVTFDVSLRIPDMEDYIREVRTAINQEWPDNQCWVFGHLGDGNLHIVVAVGDDLPATRERMEELVYRPLQKLSGSVSAEHGIGLEKKAWLPLSRSSTEIQLMKTLKQALDPDGILNPGKIFDPD